MLAGFIRVHVVSLGRALVSLVFARVYSGAPTGRRVHLGFRGFTQSRRGVAVFIQVHLRSTSGRRVHSGSHRFSRALQDVAGFIRDPVG